MNDKHDPHEPNPSVPIGTFTATADDGAFEIPIEIVADDDIEPGTLAIQTREESTRAYDDHTPAEVPRRKRVQTLMGVAMPGATLNALPTRPVAHDPTRASQRALVTTIDDALDEQPTGIYDHARDSGGLQALESMLEAQLIELPGAAPPREIVGVVGRATATGTYEINVRDAADELPQRSVLAPAQFIDTRARDAHAPSGLQRGRTEPQPLAASGPGLSAGVPVRGVAQARSAAVSGGVPSSRSRDVSARPKSAPVSSLAPAEIPRSTAMAPPESSWVGYGLVAAMLLLGIGGWWITAGGYRRGDERAAQPVAAAHVAKPAPAADPLAPAIAAVATTTSPPAPVAPPPPVALEREPPLPTAARVSKPKLAAKARREATPAPVAALDGALEAPSRTDVLNGLDTVRDSVQACAGGRTGVAEVDVTIAANGVVTHALVGGDFGGTPQGSCMARAVRKAKFPSFKQDRYRVLFPYIL